MSVNPWLVVFAFVAGVLVERLRAQVSRARVDPHTADTIRKLEAGEYGERLRAKWEKRKSGFDTSDAMAASPLVSDATLLRAAASARAASDARGMEAVEDEARATHRYARDHGGINGMGEAIPVESIARSVGSEPFEP